MRCDQKSFQKVSIKTDNADAGLFDHNQGQQAQKTVIRRCDLCPDPQPVRRRTPGLRLSVHVRIFKIA